MRYYVHNLIHYLRDPTTNFRQVILFSLVELAFPSFSFPLFSFCWDGIFVWMNLIPSRCTNLVDYPKSSKSIYTIHLTTYDFIHNRKINKWKKIRGILCNFVHFFCFDRFFVYINFQCVSDWRNSDATWSHLLLCWAFRKTTVRTKEKKKLK